MLKTILDYALDYQTRGFSVVPLKADGAKCPYVRWKEFQTRCASEEEIIKWFETWPKANVGIVTGAVSGLIVVDGDGEIGGRWIADNLPVTSVYARTGRKAGVHAYYKAPIGREIRTKVGWRPDVDLKGDGGLVVAPPSVHHSGAEYKFIFPQAMNGWDDLTEFPADFHLQPGKGNLNLDLSKVRAQGEEFAPAKKGERNATMASVLGKLFRAGMTPDQAWDYIEVWNSKNQPPIGDREVKSTFRSILKLHEGNPPPVEVAPEPVIAPAPSPIAVMRTDLYPVECLQPGGLLQEIMEYTEVSSARHKPLFALAGALALVGNLCGQRVMTETHLRTNVYAISLGYSSGGKNAPHHTISTILGKSDAAVSAGSVDVASGAGMLRWMSTDNRQVSIFAFDEIGMMLKGLKNPQSPLAEMPRLLTRMFSETGVSYSKGYADSKLNITIPYHHLSFYASSTPSAFWESMTEADTVSGFLARILIFESKEVVDNEREIVERKIPKGLMDGVNALWGITPPIDPERGDIARVPVPFIVPKSAEATEYFLPWKRRYFKLQNDAREEEARSSVYGRAAEHASKLALIHAASLYGPKVVKKEVGLESVVWACKLVDACVSAILAGIKGNIAKNTFHAEQQKVIRALAGSPHGGLSVRDVQRKIRLPRRTTGEIISSLVASGEIREEDRTTRQGTPAPWIFLEEKQVSH